MGNTNGNNRKSREDILTLVKKLLNVTTERGATEAEATVAMEKAQKLMFDYNLTSQSWFWLYGWICCWQFSAICKVWTDF
jgi:hypothetical protein